MAARSSTARAPGARSGGRRVRFPCGHLEPERAVGGRVRRTPGAAWVSCRACNLIVLAIPGVAPPAGV